MLGRRRGGAEGRLPNSRRERGIEDEDENEDDYDCCSFEVDGQLVAVDGFGAGGIGDAGAEINGEADGRVQGGGLARAGERRPGWIVEDGEDRADYGAGGSVGADGNLGTRVPVGAGGALRFCHDCGGTEFKFEGYVRGV